MSEAKTLMLQGTSSDVGKSLLTAALCRIFRQDGYRVAPFKSQNMTLNTAVTADGKEIGSAQAMQADACGIPATTDMNPILLKPMGDMVSQVILHGKPHVDLDARCYRERFLTEAEQTVRASLARLRADFDLVLIEGAGSPAEVNLKKRDIVNMRLAAWADAPVLLVADIDRGGVFASLIGTMEILTPAERARVAGFVINKFRGDLSLLQPGLEWLKQKTGKPVAGVVPYIDRLGLEDEDSLSLDASIRADAEGCTGDKLDIAVLRLPRIANFTDFDPLMTEPDVCFRYVTSSEQWGSPDAVILPGSKNTFEDVQFVRSSGLADKLIDYVHNGGHCVGLGSGYHMMGEKLIDPEQARGDRREVRGLSLLPLSTTYSHSHTNKTTRVRGTARLFGAEQAVTGYTVDTGIIRVTASVRQPFQWEPDWQADGRAGFGDASTRRADAEAYGEGAVDADGNVWGTSMHGIFHNDGFRRLWLNMMRESRGWNDHPSVSDFGGRREAAFDRLADTVRASLDMQAIKQWAGVV